VIDYRLLGSVEAAVDGRPLDIGGRKQRALLALFLLRPNESVPRDVLVDRLWGERPPAGAQHTLEVYISRLRKSLEPAAGSQVVLTRPGAYLFLAQAEQVDVTRFERLAAEGRRALAAGEPARAAADLRAALKLWRGSPLADVSNERFAQPEITRLSELWIGILEDRVEADLAMGRHADLVSELGALVAAHPLRERLYRLLMIALYRCGRQSEALAVYQSARRVLVDELGIEPGPALKRIERAVLEHDSSLEPPELAPARARKRSPGMFGSRRNRVVIAAVACLALVAALILTVSARHRRASNVTAGPDTVAVVDAGRSVLSDVLSGIGTPGGIASGLGATWVTDTAAGQLVRVDSARQVVDRITVGRGPAGVVVGSGEVWLADEFDNTVSEVNPQTGTVVATIPVGGGPTAIAYGYGSVWVANVTDSTLSKIDPRRSVVTATVPLGSQPAGVTAGAGGVWVASAQTGRLLLVNPHRNRVVRVFSVGASPGSVTVGGGRVWASDAGGTVARLDPQTGAVHEIKVGGSPAAVTYAIGAVWVANSLGSVLRIDPRTSAVRSIRIGNEPSGIASDGGDVLLTVLPSRQSHRGGTLTLDAQFTMTRFPPDPASAWNSWYWQMLIMTNDGLVGYTRVGGPAGDALVPDLATALARPAGDGRTYVFHVRPGIRYSNGQLVRPEDFRRALERVFAVNHGSGPASDFYSGIVGATACERRPQSCDLARGIVTNDRVGTVTFHLTAPDPDFLDKLALPFADAVPAGTPLHAVSITQLPATGPYVTRSFAPSRMWVLVRNPRFRVWSALAQPGGYPNKIVLRLGVAPDAAVNGVEQGHADVMFTAPPVDRVGELSTRYANLLHTYPLGDTFTLFLNTRTWPFSVLAARQAVNYAVDRSAIIKMLGGSLTAQPTCQILPPTLPGYRAYCPYTINPGPSGAWQAPDLARARQLVRASHTAGARVTVVTSAWPGDPPPAAIGHYLVSVLGQLGYRASLRVVNSNAYYPMIMKPRNRVQVGEFNWYNDFPAPSDFIVPMFSCPSSLHGWSANFNVSGFCDHRIDAQATQALAAQTRSPNAAAALWADIDREIANQAPWAPLFNERQLVVLSARVGNYQFHPFWQLLLDQLWVR
jgi:YVTN family beta-propeller protein